MNTKAFKAQNKIIEEARAYSHTRLLRSQQSSVWL